MKKWVLIIFGVVLIGVILVWRLMTSGLNEFVEGFQVEHNLKDSNLVLMNVEISPDQKFKLVAYQFDRGGFGYSRVYWSVVPNDSTMFNLEEGIFPDGYRGLGWTKENELIIEKWEPYYYKDGDIDLTDKSLLNGVRIMIKE